MPSNGSTVVRCSKLNAGTVRIFTLVMTPSAPRPHRAAWNNSGLLALLHVTRSPDGVAIVNSSIIEEREPMVTPLPWVEVEIAPAMVW